MMSELVGDCKVFSEDFVTSPIDELGYVRFSNAGNELTYEVISQAYERLGLIVTTHLSFEQWIEVMDCERLTRTLLGRLPHRGQIVEANGVSYRLKDVRKRYGKTKKEQSQGAGRLVALRVPDPPDVKNPTNNPTLGATLTLNSNDQPSCRFYPVTRTIFHRA